MQRCMVVLVILAMVPAVGSAQAFGVTSAAVGAPDSAAARAPVVPKDAATATLLGVVITGGGQMYAGRPGKGGALLAISLGAVGIGALASHGAGCDLAPAGVGEVASPPAYTCHTASHGPLIAGLVVAGVSWLYGIVSAPQDVASYNARIPARTSAVRPVMDERNGRTLVGLSLALR